MASKYKIFVGSTDTGLHYDNLAEALVELWSYRRAGVMATIKWE